MKQMLGLLKFEAREVHTHYVKVSTETPLAALQEVGRLFRSDP